MRSISFRLKLLLAMMLVVLGTTTITLYISRKRVEDTYQKLLEDQSRAQIQFFVNVQEARLAKIKDKCLDLVNNSVRLRAALQEAIDPGGAEAINLLYSRVNDELREMNPDMLFLFFDGKGRILTPTETDGRFGRLADPEFRTRCAPAGRAVSDPAQQQLGMLGKQVGANQWQLEELVITKVIDPLTHETLGALLLVSPVAATSSGAASSPMLVATALPANIKFGIWLEHRLFSRPEVIPDNLRDEIGKAITIHLARSETDFPIWPDTDPHRVFLQALPTPAGLPAVHLVSLYSLAEARAAERQLRAQILAAGGFTLLGALAISLLLTHGLSVPLRELAAGTHEVQSGNFDVKVRVRSRDDIGQLAESFNAMAEGLALKEKYRTVLNLVADEKVAHQLVHNRAVLGGELRDVTVLFCDVRGFTALTQQMPPEEVIEMLNEHMSTLSRVVKQHNGVVDKFVGDSLMAIFGAPVSHENDALDAATCALALIIAREELNITSPHPLHVGVGLATGGMVAGCMGSSDRLNYTVLGERVNLAARLCAQAHAGQAIIDQNSHDRLRGAIDAVPLPELSLKGFSEAVVAYELHRAGDTTLRSKNGNGGPNATDG